MNKKNRLEELKNYLKALCPQGIALAFSGGVDSALLLHLLSLIKKEKDFNLIALMAFSSFQKKQEFLNAKQIALQEGIELIVFNDNPLDILEVKNNSPQRCYYCKKHLFSTFVAYAKQNQYAVILDGTNQDDINVYRPGRKALKELGIISPLADLKITKQEIREMAKGLGLSAHKTPSAPCLATRFPYNTLLTEEKIEQVEQAEAFLCQLFPKTNLRLRVHDALARIEVPQQCFSELINQKEIIITQLKALGFDYVTLDLSGFSSGRMDVGLEVDEPSFLAFS